jgi:hypothetical protein
VNKFLVIFLSIAVFFAVTSTASAQPQAPSFFFAHLSGDEEVPPRETDARGLALYLSNRSETEIKYTILVAQIENVFMAHIHCGADGVNGPVGVTLFHAPVGGGPVNGILASGEITAPDPGDPVTGNPCGWRTVADVITAMRGGNTYTNVHTNDGIAPPNTGPGDFPGGEIRGQNRGLP